MPQQWRLAAGALPPLGQEYFGSLLHVGLDFSVFDSKTQLDFIRRADGVAIAHRAPLKSSAICGWCSVSISVNQPPTMFKRIEIDQEGELEDLVIKDPEAVEEGLKYLAQQQKRYRELGGN